MDDPFFQDIFCNVSLIFYHFFLVRGALKIISIFRSFLKSQIWIYSNTNDYIWKKIHCDFFLFDIGITYILKICFLVIFAACLFSLHDEQFLQPKYLIFNYVQSYFKQHYSLLISDVCLDPDLKNLALWNNITLCLFPIALFFFSVSFDHYPIYWTDFFFVDNWIDAPE